MIKKEYLKDKNSIRENLTTVGYSLVCLSLTIFGAYYGALIVNVQTPKSFLCSVLSEPRKNIALFLGLLILTILFIDFFFRIRRCLGKDLSDEQREDIKSRAIFQNIIITILVAVLICFLFVEDVRYMTLFIFMTIIFIICTFFYIKALDRRYEPTFKRMSYNIFYPSILTIGLNVYLGMTVMQFNTVAIARSKMYLLIGNLIPLFFFIGFFGITAFFELQLYKLSSEELSNKSIEKRSRDRFCLISCTLLFLAVILLLVVSLDVQSNTFIKVLHRALLNLIASLLVSLFFSIFEGWDAIQALDNETRNRNIRTINIFMLFYPVLLYALCVVIPAKIFNQFFIIAFWFHTVFCVVIWILGNSKDSKEYTQTKWARWKMVLGLAAIALMMMSITVSANNKQTIFENDKIVFVGIIFEIIMGARVLKDSGITSESYDIFWNYCRNGKMFRIYSIIAALGSIFIYIFYYMFSIIVNSFSKSSLEMREDILLDCVFCIAVMGFIFFLFSILGENVRNSLSKHL
ncbi:hypothetical protein AALA90_00080 [Lachnospiraceae bacterium 38-10]